MVIHSIQYTFAPEDAETVAAMLRELREATRKEPGVVFFEVGRSGERPNVFVLWEQYRDEAAAEAHKATGHFKRFVLDGIRQLALQRNAETVVPV